MQAPSSAPAAWFAQAASPPVGPLSSHGLLSVLVPVLLWRRGGWLFGAGCTDNPVTHQLKNMPRQ
jgi:hypothetical protein